MRILIFGAGVIGSLYGALRDRLDLHDRIGLRDRRNLSSRLVVRHIGCAHRRRCDLRLRDIARCRHAGTDTGQYIMAAAADLQTQNTVASDLDQTGIDPVSVRN